MRTAVLLAFGIAALASAQNRDVGRIVVSANHRFLQHEDGRPFFWLADTGWFTFQKLNRVETERYLEDRRSKGFNVIQAMVLHSVADKNALGAAALIEGDPARPALSGYYSYWDHVDWVVDLAASKGLYFAMVPAWGSIVKSGQLNMKNVETYARFLGQRYKKKPNVFWMNGGDLQGDIHPEVWRTLGRTLKETAPLHLITFHPFGRTRSSTWFHNEPWLDFNMFQSGHRRYDQGGGDKGEDNWRYVLEDLARQPPKPTLDGEPSYENIPQGLHDPKQPRWTDRDVRRYAYWSVFAGAFGHTYGNNAVMQMHKPGDTDASYGVRECWCDEINAAGAVQMQHLKNLILGRPFFERVNDQSVIAGQNGTRYERVTATRGASYLFAYTYNGHPFQIRMGAISGKQVQAFWYDPRNGQATSIGNLTNQGVRTFTPPEATDWVLVLDDAAKQFRPPGVVRND